MKKTRRLELNQVSSHKFYELSIEKKKVRWWVITRWGNVGFPGRRIEKDCVTQGEALTYVSNKIQEKIVKGYVEVEIDENQELPESYQKESDNVELSKSWSKFKDELLPGERTIYERHDDGRTKQRRNAISAKWKLLVDHKASSEEVYEVRKAAWLFLRYVYLNYLVSVSIYKPAVLETARATVTVLRQKLKDLPEEQRKVIDTGLKAFTSKSGPLSLRECEIGVSSFIDELTKEIKEKQKVGLGGVSRKRLKVLRRRLKKNEEENRTS